jgi:tetratricopeptide (TPR) repeat protein
MPEDGRRLNSAPSASRGTRLAGLRSIIAVAGPEAVPQARDPRKESALARIIRAREVVAGKSPAAIAAIIRRECESAYGTTWIRAYRLALGIALADVVAQVRACYEAEGRNAPRFSETLLSAYESGQKRPGPEYLHYLCAVYRADPPELGYEGRCFCGREHTSEPGVATVLRQPAAAAAPPAERAGLRVRSASKVKPLAAVPTVVVTSAPAAPIPRQRSSAGRTGAGGNPGNAHPDNAHPDDAHRDDALRGMLLALITDAGAAADSRFFGAADCLRRQMDDALLGRTVSVTMLDQWEETTAGYGVQYMTVPPLRLLCDVLLDFADIRRMCAQRQPIECAERLCRLAAQLAGLAGLAMINLGDQRLARSFFRTARTAADETGDRRLRAWVAVREALVPLYYGDPREAATLARAGTDLAGRQPCAAGVMSPVIEARALARMAGRGRREAMNRARGAFDRAHDALSELPAADRDDTAFGYTERQLFFHQGDALVTLGDYQGATRAFAQAARMYSRAEFLDRALVMLGEARCLAEADEPEHALRLGQDTLLSLPRQQRTEIVAHAARGLGESIAARHPGLPALRDYSDALRGDLCRDPHSRHSLSPVWKAGVKRIRPGQPGASLVAARIFKAAAWISHDESVRALLKIKSKRRRIRSSRGLTLGLPAAAAGRAAGTCHRRDAPLGYKSCRTGCQAITLVTDALGSGSGASGGRCACVGYCCSTSRMSR